MRSSHRLDPTHRWYDPPIIILSFAVAPPAGGEPSPDPAPPCTALATPRHQPSPATTTAGRRPPIFLSTSSSRASLSLSGCPCRHGRALPPPLCRALLTHGAVAAALLLILSHRAPPPSCPLLHSHAIASLHRPPLPNDASGLASPHLHLHLPALPLHQAPASLCIRVEQK